MKFILSLGVLVFCVSTSRASVSPLSECAPLDLQLERARQETATWARAEEARIYFYLGRELQGEEAEKKFELGLTSAGEAKTVSHDPKTLLWWVANQGELSSRRRNLASLKRIKEIQKMLIELKEMAPEFGYAAADRVLAKIYEAAPKVLSIGSDKKAEEHYLSALKIAPDYPGNRIMWAEFLVKEGRRAEAYKVAEGLKGSLLLEADYGDFCPERPSWPERLSRVMNESAEGTRS